MKKLYSLIIVFLIFFSSFYFLKSANAVVWANANYNYRVSHIINSASNANVSYPVSITIINGSGANSGSICYENNKTRSDFGDIIFYSNDNTTVLNYLQENVNSGINSTFWFQMSSDNIYGNLSNTNQMIWIYYGNSTKTTLSNGENTFPLLYDDFSSYNSSKFTNTTGVSYSSGIVNITNGDHKVTSVSSFGNNTAIRFRANVPAVDQNFLGYVLSLSTPFAIFQYYSGYGGSIAHTALTSDVRNTITSFTGAYYVFDVLRYSSVQYLLDYVSVKTHVQTITTSMPVVFEQYSGNANLLVDWVLVRNYVNPEPSHGTWTNEENNGVQVTFNGSNALNLTDSMNKAFIFTRSGTETENLQVFIKTVNSFNREGLSIESFTNNLIKTLSFSRNGIISFNLINSIIDFIFAGIGGTIPDFVITMPISGTFILLLILFVMNIILMIKKIPLVSFIVGIFTLVLSIASINDSSIPLTPTSTILFAIVGVLSMLFNVMYMEND